MEKINEEIINKIESGLELILVTLKTQTAQTWGVCWDLFTFGGEKSRQTPQGKQHISLSD